ncbi:MAG: alpha/beta hydrolase [Dokdonella sp.]
MKKSVQYAIVAAIVIGVVAIRQWREAPDSAPAEAASTGRYVIAAGANEFRFGTLDFKSCELPQKRSAATTAAFCSTFEVPENRDAPNVRTLALDLALIRSSDAAADDDFIVFLAGGPGQAAIETWPQIAGALELARKGRHVLLIDQRGTGGSNALNCAAEDSDALADLDLALIRKRTRQCLDGLRNKADPRYYTTTDAVHDLEDLRVALGSPRFNLVGVSYGTRVALQYHKRHPEAVRTIVLDSPAPNELVLGAQFARNLDDALKAQFARCAKDADCAIAFPDPYASLVQLRDALRATPKTVRYADPVTFEPVDQRLDGFGLVGLVRMFAYTPETAALIPLSVQQASADNFEPLMGQLKLMTDGIGELAGSGMQLSVICAEDADRLVADSGDADTLLGPMMVDVLRAQCEIWPRGERPADFTAPASGDTPTLILAGEFDPVTPPRYGEQILATLGNARLIVAAGQGHNVIGRGCLPKLVGEFIDKRNPKTLDTACAERLGATPHFINFNGASP